MKITVRTALLATTALGFMLAGPAHAADGTADAIKALQAQVNALQKQLTDMQAKEVAKAKAEAAKPAAEPAKAAADGKSTEILPGVKVKLGGYIAMEGVYRDKNQVTDMNSNINSTIPYANDRRATQDEFRGSARATRLSLTAEGKPDENTALTAYVETDFMGAGSTSNSVQTNSYVPRLRQAWAKVDRNDWGFHFVGGQTFTLATLYKSGLLPGQEAGVIGIDAVGSAGYVYDRGPGVRFVKDFMDKKLQAAVSLESPQVNFGGLSGPAVATAWTTGNSPLNTGNYSMDYAPDVIAKVGYDTSFGHYELFGLARFFRDSVTTTAAGPTTNYHNNYAMGKGIGVGAFVPVIAKKLEVQGNFMIGEGIGRYSAGQMPDFAFTSTGDIKPIEQMVALFGVIGHPTPSWDLYLYAGAEKAMRQDYGNVSNAGYGSQSLDNRGCYYQGGSCSAQTQLITHITPGFWTQLYKGDYGSMKFGAQYSLTRKDAFTDSRGLNPHAYENVVMTSFRYAPF